MPKARTTIHPLIERTYSAREFAELKANGLVLDTEATTDKALMSDAAAQLAERGSPFGYDSTDEDGDGTTVQSYDGNAPVDINVPDTDESDDSDDDENKEV